MSSIWLREPKTNQERRMSFDDQDGTVRIRLKRKKESLPTTWDDKGRGDYSHRCWKRHRLTQYK